jgi:hypothetical protein
MLHLFARVIERQFETIPPRRFEKTLSEGPITCCFQKYRVVTVTIRFQDNMLIQLSDFLIRIIKRGDVKMIVFCDVCPAFEM